MLKILSSSGFVRALGTLQLAKNFRNSGVVFFFLPLSSWCGRGSGRHPTFFAASACEDSSVFSSFLVVFQPVCVSPPSGCNSRFSVPCCDSQQIARAAVEHMCKTSKNVMRTLLLELDSRDSRSRSLEVFTRCGIREGCRNTATIWTPTTMT